MLPLRVPHYPSSTRVCLTRLNRELYGRMYPVYLAFPNGATIRIRYREPRHVLQVNFSLNRIIFAYRSFAWL